MKDTRSRTIESIDARNARVRTIEQGRRNNFSTSLEGSADAYLVKRGQGKTLIAGYPWFGDWGRDTFIALRGLCIATGCLGEARDILLQWAGAVSEGMLPNGSPIKENSLILILLMRRFGTSSP